MIQPGKVYMALHGRLRPCGAPPGDRGVPGGAESRPLCVGRCLYVRSKLSNCVPFRAGDFGFTVECVAQCENILSIDQAQIDLATGPIGILDEAALQRVIKSIGYVIKSDCRPL